MKNDKAQFMWRQDESDEWILCIDYLKPLPLIDWQYIHIGLGCYIEQDNPELNPVVVLDLSPDADEYTETFQPNSPY